MNRKKTEKKELSSIEGTLILGNVCFGLCFVIFLIFFLVRQHDLGVSPYDMGDSHLFRMNSIAMFELGILISKTFFIVSGIAYVSYFLQKIANNH
jgi:hypothetical protein